MKTVTTAEFRKRCLALLAQVQRKGQPLLVMRDGEPLVVISPYAPVARDSRNLLKGTILYQGDLVAPLAISWNSAPRNSAARRRVT